MSMQELYTQIPDWRETLKVRQVWAKTHFGDVRIVALGFRWVHVLISGIAFCKLRPEELLRILP